MKKYMQLLGIVMFAVSLAFTACGGDDGDGTAAKTYAIGDIGPSGVGIVFYVSDDGLSGLEVAPEDQSEEVNWSTKTGWANGTDKRLPDGIGTGSANTDAIITQNGGDASAAKICRVYRAAEEGDWFLPSKDELNAIWDNLVKDSSGFNSGVGNFVTLSYWSSSELNVSAASIQEFNQGKITPGVSKTEEINRVRAVRAFQASDFSVTYNAGTGTFGTVPVDEGSFRWGDTVTVLGNTKDLRGKEIRDGIRQRFLGWNTESAATTPEYVAGKTFNITKDITLYAIYTIDDEVLRKVGPAGGWVFYDAQDAMLWGKYLEAWNEDESGKYKWKTAATSTAGTSTEIGTGYFNTYDEMTGPEHPAAAVVRNARYGGFENWFLPSQEELQAIWDNLVEDGSGVGGFSEDAESGYYWSSSSKSEIGVALARCQNFSNGISYDYPKNHEYRVRAVRAFFIETY